jgi:hypothetical protein
VTTERPAEPAAASNPAAHPAAKLPPFTRGSLPTLGQPLTSVLPAVNADGVLVEAPSTLLFNDVAEDALMCDPDDPDCELV